MTDLALFGMDPVPPPGPEEKLSRGRRRTLRQAQALAHGRHPVGLCFGFVLRLHPDAAPAGDHAAPGLRCGGCRFREMQAGGGRSYPKCMRGDGAPYGSHGEASDVRAWWPACVFYEPALAAETTGAET